MHESDGRNYKLQARVDPQTLERLRRVADELFDGNAAMLVRRAVKEFIAEHEAQQATEKRELEEAVA